MREIREGDIVKCCWVIYGEHLNGVVLHTPQDVGDLWQIKDKNGDIHAINPNCSNFECIVKQKIDNPEIPKEEIPF